MRKLWRELRLLLALTAAFTLACRPVHGLVALNDGHDRIYVAGALSVSGDSNVYANSDERSDVLYSTSVTADYTRRAGWIGVNASVAVSSAEFAELKEENYTNPSYSLEFTKQSGRTTGSLILNAARESRADAAVNLRSTSWNYGTGLNVKYPIVGMYTLSAQLGYNARDYVDKTVFANLETYSASADLLRMLGSERDLMLGYRYRFNDTSFNTSTTDHSFTVGLNGRLIRGLTGALRAGYQVRTFAGAAAGEDAFSSWTASGSVSYAISKKMSLSAQISKDLSITATDSSVDVTSASISARYAYSSRWSLSASGGWGYSRFLGDRGRVVVTLGPPLVLGPQRDDSFLSWNAGLGYSLNEHINFSAGYSWFKNWSALSYADFVRTSWSASVSSRW
ncbi:MAG: outer membrane beta-barrel protein [Opitutaceae bacterium]|nr:outer membrane beta-barrel protein [Opitutaceae bacterium]